MKRARKKNSKRRNIIEEDMSLYNGAKESSDYEAEAFDGADEDFAVPEEAFAVTEESFAAEAEGVMPEAESFAEVTEPEDFAVPEEIFQTDRGAINADAGAGEAEGVSGEEEPFAAAAFSEGTEPDVVAAAETQHSEDYLKRKAMNKKKFEQKRRRKRIRTVCIAVFAVLFILAASILGMDFSGGDGDDFTTPVDVQTGKINVLLLGVDKDGERSDSIMLVSYDFDDHSINLLSVPRDTKMYVTDRGVTRKITEVHGMHDSAGKMYGASAVAEAVTALTGVPINYYLEFSFDALDNVMDILGPVEFDVPDIEGGGRGMNYDDGYQDLHIHLKPGPQELSGNQIQQFLRYRKSNNGTSDGSDISRVGRQQELLKAIIDQKIVDGGVGFIVKVPEIFKEIKSQIKTNFGVKDVIKYAGYLKDVSSENMNTYVLPGESAKTSGAWYFVYDKTATAELISTSFGYEVAAEELTNEISLTGKKTTGKTKQNEEKKQTTSGADNTSSGKSTSAVKDDTSSKKNSSAQSGKSKTEENTAQKSTAENTQKSTAAPAAENETKKSDAAEAKKEEQAESKPADNEKNDTAHETEENGADKKDADEDEAISLD